jgi:hypothetical protein
MSNKAIGRLILLSLILTFSLVLSQISIVNATPGLLPPYYSKPSTHVITGGLTVDGRDYDPTYAYDLDNTTAAQIQYDSTDFGSFEVKGFNITAAPANEYIAFVDFKMHYSADSAVGSGDDQYRIVYFVKSAGPVVLQDWTSDGFSLATRVWYDQPEPYDGVWNWTDISNIRFIVQCRKVGGRGANYFYEYEAWVSVFTYRKAKVSVDPTTLINPTSPFTIVVNVTNVDDLYGWEFKLYYNSTLLNASRAAEGPFLKSGGSTWFKVINFTDNYNATHGLIWATCTLLGDVPGVSGGGDLAIIEFKIVAGPGDTPLALEDTKLVGYEFVNKRLTFMVHDSVDGYVTIAIEIPEFPLGAALEISLVGVIVYLWWRTKRKGTKLSSCSIPTKSTYFLGRRNP